MTGFCSNSVGISCLFFKKLLAKWFDLHSQRDRFLFLACDVTSDSQMDIRGGKHGERVGGEGGGGGELKCKENEVGVYSHFPPRSNKKRKEKIIV
jgi:hypothetical protein